MNCSNPTYFNALGQGRYHKQRRCLVCMEIAQLFKKLRDPVVTTRRVEQEYVQPIIRRWPAPYEERQAVESHATVLEELFS